jgi:hypothetical protein
MFPIISWNMCQNNGNHGNIGFGTKRYLERSITNIKLGKDVFDKLNYLQ